MKISLKVRVISLREIHICTCTQKFATIFRPETIPVPVHELLEKNFGLWAHWILCFTPYISREMMYHSVRKETRVQRITDSSNSDKCLLLLLLLITKYLLLLLVLFLPLSLPKMFFNYLGKSRNL